MIRPILLAGALAASALAQSIAFPGPGPGGPTGSTPYAITQTSGTYASTVGRTTTLIRGQSFTPLQSMHVNTITLLLSKTGSPTDNLIVELWTSQGTSPTAKPLALLQSSPTTLSGSTVTTSLVSYDFSFPSTALSAGTKYWITAHRSGALDDLNYFNWGYSTGSVYQDGGFAAAASNGSWTVESGYADNVFTVTGVTP